MPAGLPVPWPGKVNLGHMPMSLLKPHRPLNLLMQCTFLRHAWSCISSACRHAKTGIFGIVSILLREFQQLHDVISDMDGDLSTISACIFCQGISCGEQACAIRVAGNLWHPYTSSGSSRPILTNLRANVLVPSVQNRPYIEGVVRERSLQCGRQQHKDLPLSCNPCSPLQRTVTGCIFSAE